MNPSISGDCIGRVLGVLFADICSVSARTSRSSCSMGPPGRAGVSARAERSAVRSATWRSSAAITALASVPAVCTGFTQL